MGFLQNPQIQQLLQRYEQLESNERVAIKGLIGFFVLLFLYFAIYSPARDFRDDSLSYYEDQSSLIQYMRTSERQARAVARQGGGAASIEGQPLLSAVSNSVLQFRIKPNRIQPEGTEGVSIWFDSVNFNDMVRWLESLNRQGVSVRQISIEREEETGMVNARIILES